jgi:hypothetical protein
MMMMMMMIATIKTTITIACLTDFHHFVDPHMA